MRYLGVYRIIPLDTHLRKDFEVGANHQYSPYVFLIIVQCMVSTYDDCIDFTLSLLSPVASIVRHSFTLNAMVIQVSLLTWWTIDRRCERPLSLSISSPFSASAAV